MPNDEIFRRFLRLSAIGYGLGAFAAAFRRKDVEKSLGRLDRKGEGPEDLWQILGAAYMSTIAAVAWLASADRRRAVEISKPLIVAKGSTTALFTLKFLKTRKPSYALAALTDASLLAATATLAKKAQRPQLRSVGGREDVFHMRADQS